MKFTKIVLPALLVILLCLVTTAFFRQSKSIESSPPSEKESGSGSAAVESAEHDPVRMCRFVLLDTALYPRQMRVNAGLINLLVEDETGISEGLVLERVVNSASERITTIRTTPSVRRGRELRRLTPGQYLVYDASKPGNKANLIVEP